MPKQGDPPRRSLEEHIVFQPSKFPDGNWDIEGTGFEDVWLETPDGLRLHGWYAEADSPVATVLYLHGNAGNIGLRQQILALYRDRLKCSTLMFDYRGYGQSQGTPSEEGVLTDARTARRWLAQRVEISEDQIVLVGNSLGGGIAVDLAASDGARALVLENTFSSLPDMVAYRWVTSPLQSVMRCRLDSVSKIPNYHGPLLQTHGDADRIVPFALGKKLFEAANEPKKFVPVRGGTHSEIPDPQYLPELEALLKSL